MYNFIKDSAISICSSTINNFNSFVNQFDLKYLDFINYNEYNNKVKNVNFSDKQYIDINIDNYIENDNDNYIDNDIDNDNYLIIIQILESISYCILILAIILLSKQIVFIYKLIKSEIEKNNENENENDNNVKKNKLYLKSMEELDKQNNKILSKLNFENDYIVVLRVKLKNYLQMNKTKYSLKNIHYHKNCKKFITKEMYMIIGSKFNKDSIISDVIVRSLNYLNNISEEKYKNDDFVIISVGSINNKTQHEFFKGLININYELFNVNDVIFNLKNNNYFKYSLTLPIYDINNMILDIFDNTVFESKLYSIDKNNNEKWNGVSLNKIGNW